MSAIYKVLDDGTAGTGKSVGDQLVTGGGTYVITGVNADGTYTSEKVSDATSDTFSYGGLSLDDTIASLFEEGGALAALSQDSGDYTSYNSALSAAQLEQQIAALTDAYNKNTASLDEAEAEIDPAYAAVRDDAATSMARNKTAWSERAAASGLNAGTSALADLARQSVYETALSKADTAETKARAALEAQREELEEQYRAARSKVRA